MMKKIFRIISVFSFFCLFCGSGYLYGDAGATGWFIFRRPQSTTPRAPVAVAAVRGDLSGIFYNPSVLGTMPAREIFLLTESGMGGELFGGLLYGQPLPLGQGAGIAAGVIYYDAGRTTLYWIEGGDLKEKTVTIQRDTMGIISYGQAVSEEILVGGSFKVASSNIAEVEGATAVGVDLGVMYFAPFYEGLSFSLAVQNIGTASEFIDKAEKLPGSVWLGTSYFTDLTDRTYMSAGIDGAYILEEQRIIPGLGIVYGYEQFSANFGYRFNTDESKLHIGFGAFVGSFDLGYSFSPATYLSHVHRLTVGYMF